MKVVPTDTDGTTWNLNLGKEIPEEMRYMKWIKVDVEGSSVPTDRKVVCKGTRSVQSRACT